MLIQSSFQQHAASLADELIDYALTAGKPYGITDVEIIFIQEDELEINVDGGSVVDLKSGFGRNIEITLYAGYRSLSFSTEIFDKASLKDSILMNAKVIKIVPENPYGALLESQNIYQGPMADLELDDGAAATVEQMKQYVRDMELTCRAQKGIKTTRASSFERTLKQSFLVATNGLQISNSSTMYGAAVQPIAENSQEQQAAYEYTSVRHFKDLPDPETVGEQGAEKAIAKLGSITPKSMSDVSIILDREAAPRYFNAFYQAIDGDEIDKGLSFLKDKIGSQIASSEITMEDDPLLKRGLASYNIDTAGLQAKKIVFIENGILKEYITDLEESRRLGTAPIGRENGRGNTTIYGGKTSPEDLIKDIPQGVYVMGFSGGKVDVNTGLHSREAYGFLIKNGVVTEVPVSGFAIVGNLRDMFNNTQLANDTPPNPNKKTSFVAPTTRINGLTIAGL